MGRHLPVTLLARRRPRLPVHQRLALVLALATSASFKKAHLAFGKMYQGPKGGVRWGIQYSYITKSGWSGAPAAAGAPGVQPKAVDNMVFTSFRYYLP